MYRICYVVPYFGKLPKNFQIWLNSCKYNKNINWLIFTDDCTNFLYPDNIKVIYTKFDVIKKLIQKKFDFEVKIDSYWCLSLFKPAYGEIFEEYLKEYDFWGHCDVDLIWGDISSFISDDVLKKYDKIGFQGHSTLYRNNREVNSRYKVMVPDEFNYIDIFSGKVKYSFDEVGMEKIYNYLNIDYYKKTNFAHLSKYDYSFYLKYLPRDFDYKNRRQVFYWDNGVLYRYYIGKSNSVEVENFMYLHFFCRPMKYLSDGLKQGAKYLIYPDKLIEFDGAIDYNLINKYGKCSKLKYYATSLYYNKKKITVKKIKDNLIRMIRWKKENK